MISRVLSAAVCLLLFGTACHMSNRLLADELIYYSRGVQSQAVLLEKRKERHSSRRNPSVSYHATYEFQVDGVKYSRKDMLDVGRGYDSLKEGQVVDVVYDPRNPELSRMVLAAPYARYSMTVLFIFAMAGVLAVLPLKILLRPSDTIDGSSTSRRNDQPVCLTIES